MPRYEVDRNQLAKLLGSAGEDTFVVHFQKRINRKTIVETLQNLETDRKTKKELSAIAEHMLSGTERVLIGRLERTEHNMGRSFVSDLELDEDSFRTRIVDHRTITKLALRSNVYVLKEA